MNDAHRDGSQAVTDRALRQLTLRHQPADRVVRSHPGASDRSGAGTAVGLQHIAVDQDAALAQGLEVKNAAQRPADQALDLLRAAALLAASSLAVTAGVGGTRQHAVLGRDPALAAATLVRRHFFFDRRGAQHPGVAKTHQHRTLGMAGIAARYRHRAQRVGAAPIVAQTGTLNFAHLLPQGFLCAERRIASLISRIDRSISASSSSSLASKGVAPATKLA